MVTLTILTLLSQECINHSPCVLLSFRAHTEDDGIDAHRLVRRAVKNGTRIIVANSNRFAAPGAAGTLSVVDTAAALAGRPVLRGHIPAGTFPHQYALAPGGRVLLVTNSSSAQLEAVDLSALP